MKGQGDGPTLNKVLVLSEKVKCEFKGWGKIRGGREGLKARVPGSL